MTGQTVSSNRLDRSALPCRHHRLDRLAQNRKAEHSALKCTTRQSPNLRVSLHHLSPLCIPADELNKAGAEANDIWSAELNVRPSKVNICIPNSPRLLDSPQELGAGSCTFEAKQYSAYRFRLPPTPGMRLVQFNPRSALPQRTVLNRHGRG